MNNTPVPSKDIDKTLWDERWNWTPNWNWTPDFILKTLQVKEWEWKQNTNCDYCNNCSICEYNKGVQWCWRQSPPLFNGWDW